MNRKFIGLLLSGALTITMVGCGSKDKCCIENKTADGSSYEARIELHKREHTDEDVLKLLREGTFTLIYNNTEYKFMLEKILDELYIDTTYKVTHIENELYEIKVGNSYGREYMIFELDFEGEGILIIEFYDGEVIYEGEESQSKFVNAVIELVDNKKIESKKENTIENDEVVETEETVIEKETETVDEVEATEEENVVEEEDTKVEDVIEEDVVVEENTNENVIEEDVVVEENTNENVIEEDVVVEENKDEHTCQCGICGSELDKNK